MQKLETLLSFNNKKTAVLFINIYLLGF